MVVNYPDGNQVINNAAWTVVFKGKSDGDLSLEATEKAVTPIWTVEYTYDNDAGLDYDLAPTRTTRSSIPRLSSWTTMTNSHSR